MPALGQIVERVDKPINATNVWNASPVDQTMRRPPLAQGIFFVMPTSKATFPIQKLSGWAAGVVFLS